MEDSPDISRSFFQAWRDEAPKIAASLTTALIIFLASLSFSSVRHALFGTTPITYPLTCSMDTIRDLKRGLIIVEIFVVNSTDRDWTEEELRRQLLAGYGGASEVPTVRVPLSLTRMNARVLTFTADDDFNAGKGQMTTGASAKSAWFTVRSIAAQSILRARLTVAGLAEAADPDVPISRVTRSEIPFDYAPLLDACYGR
jgi:hypothetical protein